MVTNVTTTRYSDLIEKIMQPSNTGGAIQSDNQTRKQTLALLLIDAEGFDCDMIAGIHEDTKFLAEFLLFDHIHCGEQKVTNTVQYLRDSLGYNVSVCPEENFVASLNKSKSTSLIRTSHFLLSHLLHPYRTPLRHVAISRSSSLVTGLSTLQPLGKNRGCNVSTKRFLHSRTKSSMAVSSIISVIIMSSSM